MGKRGKSIRWLLVTWSSLLCSTVVLSRPEDVLTLNEVFVTPPEVSEKTQIKENSNSSVEDCKCATQNLCENGTIDKVTNESEICKNYFEQCCKTSEIVDLATEMPKERSGCGLRNEGGLGFRIAEGYDANFGEFPWMIMILKETAKNVAAYQCGGSLIHPQVVLTAAHCILNINKELLKVRGGEWNTENSEESLPYQDRNIYEIIFQNFNRGTGYNDIALLVLEEAFAKFDNIGIICLPRPDDIILDKDCIATGWGMNSLGGRGRYQETLKKVNLTLVSREACEKIRKIGRPDYKLHESFVCASGVDGADTCKGDGGSPLVCPVRNGVEMQYQQVGVVSWGEGCGTESPGIYANVAHFVTWIDKQMNDLGFQPNYYY